MKKSGILNQAISEVIAGMGHGDLLVISDCGLPMPPGVRRIDIALLPGVPGFLQTLRIILGELKVESAVIAIEMSAVSSDMNQCIQEILDDIPVNSVSHKEFKNMTKRAAAIIRTGECTPYANIILKSGVIF